MIAMRLLLVTAAIGLGLSPLQAQDDQRQPDWVAVIGCELPFGHICHVTFFDDAAMPAGFVRLEAGQRWSMPVYGRVNYTYVMTIDQNFSWDPTCRRAEAAGVPCRLEMLKPGYNR